MRQTFSPVTRAVSYFGFPQKLTRRLGSSASGLFGRRVHEALVGDWRSEAREGSLSTGVFISPSQVAARRGALGVSVPYRLSFAAPWPGG